jgi:hypothetical protein
MSKWVNAAFISPVVGKQLNGKSKLMPLPTVFLELIALTGAITLTH